VRRRSFRSFFETATGLRTGPYEYQANLAECELLPDILAVPTGCGRTAATVLSWAWRRRECPDSDIRQRTPRRLVYCLPMRSLVEQVHDDIIEWFVNLGWLQRPQSLADPYRPDWCSDDGEIHYGLVKVDGIEPESSATKKSNKGQGIAAKARYVPKSIQATFEIDEHAEYHRLAPRVPGCRAYETPKPWGPWGGYHQSMVEAAERAGPDCAPCRHRQAPFHMRRRGPRHRWLAVSMVPKGRAR